MGFAPLHTFAAALALALAGSVVVAGVAEAQQNRQAAQRPKVTITKERSYLDPGPIVRPGSQSDLNYALPLNYNYPTFSPAAAEPGPITGMRWPLPGPFDLPGY